MSKEAIELANPGVQTLQPYQPGKPIDELKRELGLQDVIKLATNENPLGSGKLARDVILTTIHELGLYPDANGHELKTALAEKLNVQMSQITLGDGSDNVLALVALAFVGPEDEVLLSEYSFATFYIIACADSAKRFRDGSFVIVIRDFVFGGGYGFYQAVWIIFSDSVVESYCFINFVIFY